MPTRSGRGRKMDEWDTTINSKAYYMNVVLREAESPLTVTEIMEGVRSLGKPEFGASLSHLRRLEGKDPKRPKAFVRRIGNRWTPITPSRSTTKTTDGTVHRPHESTATTTIVEDIFAAFANSGLQPTTRQNFVEARLGQGKFRDDILAAWGDRCAITGSTTKEAIRASHIKPWRDSTDTERLDPENGIPLIATLDALFDRGLISFTDSGMILISKQLSVGEQTILGIADACLSRDISKRCQGFLAFHRKRFGHES